MRRVVLAVFVGLASVACLGAIVWMVRAYIICDIVGVSFFDEGPQHYLLRHVYVQSNRGIISVFYRTQHVRTQAQTQELREIVSDYNRGRKPDRYWRESWPVSSVPMALDWWSLLVTYRDSSRFMGSSSTGPVDRMRTVAFPHVYLIAATALVPLITAWRWRRIRRRRRLGLCRGCGYDLRASTGRCPECGREIA